MNLTDDGEYAAVMPRFKARMEEIKAEQTTKGREQMSRRGKSVCSAWPSCWVCCYLGAEPEVVLGWELDDLVTDVRSVYRPIGLDLRRGVGRRLT